MHIFEQKTNHQNHSSITNHALVTYQRLESQLLLLLLYICIRAENKNARVKAYSATKIIILQDALL